MARQPHVWPWHSDGWYDAHYLVVTEPNPGPVAVPVVARRPWWWRVLHWLHIV